MEISRTTKPRSLRAGDVIEVRSEEEILATLGPDSTIDGLPFMPEMLRQCGSRFTVDSRADTTCFYGALRGMESAVHLTGIRCDGSGHGGCQAGCLVYWKEEWLRPVDPSRDDARTSRPIALAPPVRRDGCTRDDVFRAVHPPESPDGEELWSCQATQVRAATRPIRSWDLRHYVRDVRNGNLRPGTVLRRILPSLLFMYQGMSRRRLPRWLQVASGADIPLIHGTLTRTPSVDLDLQPGDLVRVKSRRKIRTTVDRKARNRGLAFDVEMTPYCGKSMRVKRVVRQIIDEWTGRMLRLPGHCVVLEGGVCQALYHGLCQRKTESYWREIWLERETPAGAEESARAAAAQS
ncbi:hypothetical protein [Geodermatophilus obscurus]|uniref:Uncharacterized protein n=1 Tax=Geodermatophilus obscurus (strain ATCC 25078 / DSM 43160 / JCM 3152 / CCUG 61914 / KCC A-0152 / KCTC 9177 / NBRC 13315 / NRRL B-3577 / G-20) TaxID=526225 RepID=D2S547_GEOOG|nr:hypothetical protein [Geodermatophilus obscurus]ADB73158.1 conserved hypothetical protein [Geodermatophilus obscurus DSM 43160]